MVTRGVHPLWSGVTTLQHDEYSWMWNLKGSPDKPHHPTGTTELAQQNPETGVTQARELDLRTPENGVIWNEAVPHKRGRHPLHDTPRRTPMEGKGRSLCGRRSQMPLVPGTGNSKAAPRGVAVVDMTMAVTRAEAVVNRAIGRNGTLTGVSAATPTSLDLKGLRVVTVASADPLKGGTTEAPNTAAVTTAVRWAARAEGRARRAAKEKEKERAARRRRRSLLARARSHRKGRRESREMISLLSSRRTP